MRSRETKPSKEPRNTLSDADKRLIDFLVKQAVKACT
jgi:hypothetical protein